jgi:hypothetical protein
MAQGRCRVRILENTITDFPFWRKPVNDLAAFVRRIYTAVPYTDGFPYYFFHFRFFD